MPNQGRYFSIPCRHPQPRILISDTSGFLRGAPSGLLRPIPGHPYLTSARSMSLWVRPVGGDGRRRHSSQPMRADASRIAPRCEVEQMLRTRSANLRKTRLQRNFSITEEGGAGIGGAMDLTSDAEHGKAPGRIAGCFGPWTFPISGLVRRSDRR